MIELEHAAIFIVSATRNQHKVAEIQSLLGPLATCVDLNSVAGAPVTNESARDFAGNASKKAMDLANHLRSNPLTMEIHAVWVLADDSGLEVDALGGAPGVHSARFAADNKSGVENATDAANRAKLLRLMQQIPAGRRQARFRCVLALVGVEPADHQPRLFVGACEGSIGFAERGANGFGYDPLFIPQGFEKTFAELGDDIKNTMSHRARAIDKLKRHLLHL